MLVITCGSIFMVVQYQSTSPLFLFFWIKVIADALIFFLWHNLRGQQLYYYYNLGIRKRLLFSFALAVDLFSFIFIHLLLSIWR